MPNIKPKTLYITLSVLMIGLVVMVYGVLMLYERSRSDALLLTQAGAAAKRIGREAAATVEAELRPARVSVMLLASGGLGRAASEAERLAALPQMAAALQGNAAVSAVYAGTTGGAFVLLRRLDDATRKRMEAPAAAAFALQSVERAGGGTRGLYRFYDTALLELARAERPEYDFDPRTRPWFELARQSAGGAVVQSAPYRFFTTGEPGVTLAQAHGDAVVGADVSLRALGEMLERPQISRSAQLLIATVGGETVAEARRERGLVSGDGQALARVDVAASPLMRTLWQRRDGAGHLESVQIVDSVEWVSHALPLPGAAEGVAPLVLMMAAPREELQAFQIESRRHGFYISLALMLLLLPVVHLLADRVSRPLRELARQAEAIERFEFDSPDPRRSLIREVDRLAVAMTAMKHSLRHFLDIAGALSAERDFDALLERILRETIAVTGASGGAVHLLSDDGAELRPAAAHLHGGTAHRAGLTWDARAAESIAAPVQALRAGEPVEVELRWDNPIHLKAYEPLFAGLSAARLRLLSLPLKNRQEQTVGTLTLSFPLPADGAAEPLGAARVAFVRALSGTAAVAIDNQLLLRARKELLESFIQLVAGAIDAKSPYTAGHCQRVPALTKMLAQAACEATDGPYASFAMDEEQWEALHIAAWLHDCGKVTTPEYVVDKATKLETIYNRIHEIRTRFEVLKRDVLIERLQAELGEAGTARARVAAADELAALEADYAFVASCNQGGEFLDPAAVERLRAIGQRTWQRTLDDGLGLSLAEAGRLSHPRPVLPATEQLLQDRPEHIVARPPSEQLTADNRWGFKLRQPEHQYHRGELHNLSVSRGTLSDEERYKINDHIVQTIKMLEALPFPSHLKTVPEIAGGHHERMDGKGYPRGLTGATMSPQARMMAIADVFEALTADDRPYKPGKRLSEALAIMRRMVAEQHLDAELFALFLRSGVCLAYARQFMTRDMVDVADVGAYLS
ncbi:HD domain-containing phosphohydrolase [Roseateles asaccharophilus]|uniref:HD-GYP domain-containing protein (C-di-GMP phosphodiesterase class II) n=1 Tax=Roseateles asaccharophilus TaxID=582607 RepID=A0ABU2AFE8_9BURK|nr:HD domain-containing phosphohydrolase [Roseateles asaccharophilus]MDR7335949.1 HD-GYP domain-containing protein (c-di-GMP phosphodiesterase class II) [Roseateles asaccharophilus]